MAVSQRESLAPAVLSRDLRSRENRLPHAKAGRLVEVVRVHLASPGGGGHAAAAAAPARLSLDQEHRQSRAPDYELHPFAREVPAGHHSFHRSAALLRGAAPRQRRPSRLGRRVAGKRHRYDHSLLRRVGRSAYPSRELRLTSCLTTDLGHNRPAFLGSFRGWRTIALDGKTRQRMNTLADQVVELTATLVRA